MDKTLIAFFILAIAFYGFFAYLAMNTDAETLAVFAKYPIVLQ